METLVPLAIAYGRALVALLLFVAGVAKVADRHHLSAVVRNYQIVPARIAKAIARMLPETEIAVAVLLLTGLSTTFAALAAAALFAVFGAAIAVNLLRGRWNIACGCFGPNENAPLTWGHVARNAAFAAIAVASVPGAWPAPPAALDTAHALASTLAAAVTLTCWWLAGVSVQMLKRASLGMEDR